MIKTMFHPTLAPGGQPFDASALPEETDGWVSHPSKFPNDKIYLYHPWKAPGGQTFDPDERPEDPEWVESRSEFPLMPSVPSSTTGANRSQELIKFCEIIRVRGYNRRALMASVESENARLSAPLGRDELRSICHEYSDIEILGRYRFLILKAVAKEMVEWGYEIDDVLAKLDRLNARSRPTLSEDEITDLINAAT